MTQPSDNVYLSISFGNIPRTKAEQIVQQVQQTAGDVDFSVDYGDPIGDQPTPVFEQTADQVGSTPVSQAPTSDAQPTPAPDIPDAEPTPAPSTEPTTDTPPPSN